MGRSNGKNCGVEAAPAGMAADQSATAGELARLLLDTPGLELERVEFPAGGMLFRQGEIGGAMYVVLEGRLLVRQDDDQGRRLEVGEITAGEVAGEIQLLTGGRRTASVVADTDVVLSRCSQEAFSHLMAQRPEAAGRVLDIIRRRLRRNQLASVLRSRFGSLDAETLGFVESLGRWRRLRGGEVLFDQGDPADSFFLLVAGRLEAVVRTEHGARVVGEAAQGESVGEMGVLTNHPRSAMVRALRESELVEFSREAFESMVRRRPEMVRTMAEVLTERLARSNASLAAGARVGVVALIPAGGDADKAGQAVDRLALRLAEGLGEHGSVMLLTSERAEELLGMGVAQTTEDSPFDIRLSAWLHEQGRQHRFLVLQADHGDTPWTRRCAMAADRVLLVGDAESDPGLSQAERSLAEAWRRRDSRWRMLVLLHGDTLSGPGGATAWLDARGGIRHVHVRLGDPEDVERLSRMLAGRALGLVFSGGGARAMAHIGVLRALLEAEVPIDAVGGASMGGIIAAQYAMGLSCDEMIRLTSAALDRLRSPANLSFGLSSVLSDRPMKAILSQACGDRRVEDLWIPFFCTSCNLYTAELNIHDRGLLHSALYATGALPGVFPPQTQDDGGFLVDGAILNGLPCDVMKRLTGGLVAGSDITGGLRGKGSGAGEGRNRKLPKMFDVLQHTTMLGSRHRLERIKQDADVYIPCEVGPDHGLLQTKGVDRLVDIGYRAGRDAADEILDLIHAPPEDDVSCW